jgi:uncharacterized protein with FMN-binding domain
MKKIALIVAVIAIFLAYSYLIRNQHSEPVVAPVALNQSKSSSNSNQNSNVTSNSATVSGSTTNSSTATTYKDGTYTGTVVNAFYGNVQVSATIQNGQITAVNFIESPNDSPNSVNVNQQAIPYLKQEAIKAQNSNVSVVTGATQTSQAFTQSLGAALAQAKQS